ncbi:MAG: arylesterase [Syntrophotalea sp.]|jgi:acyl-CoA thioesterase-1|uniref:arylesterase n=1 Tax=Syntrophotalea sp. TaxID=2812029 RepID=UPI003D0ACA47
MPKQPVRILAFGDSLTAGWGLQPSKTVPACLESTLIKEGFDVSFINAGVPGETTEGGIRRFEKALGCNPDLVILELGANDNLQALPLTVTKTNLDAMLGILAARNIPALFAGIRPLRDLGPDTNFRFVSLFHELASRHAVPFYPDYLDGVAGNPMLLQKDGLHPNARGAREIAKRLRPLVIDMLRALEGSAPAGSQP